MANALDAVLQMRRERLAREQADNEAIERGLTNLGTGMLNRARLDEQRRQFDAADQRQRSQFDIQQDLRERQFGIQQEELGLKKDKFEFDKTKGDDVLSQIKDLREIRGAAVDARDLGLMQNTDSAIMDLLGKSGAVAPDRFLNKSPDVPKERFEKDPFTGKLTEQGQLDFEAAKLRTKKEEELTVAKEELGRNLEGILALESTIPRSGEGGVDRFFQGARNFVSSTLQQGDIGENIATYSKMIDLITPKVARASGDVANIAVAEREFSKGIFATLSDSVGVSEKKRAALVDFTKAVKENNGSAIKEILKREGVAFYDKATGEWVNRKGSGGNVRVRLPDGRIGSFPEESLQKALDLGAEVLDA